MPEEIKILNGGLNTDDSPENISQRDYISANNFRSTGSSELDELYGANIESTELITPVGQLNFGINKAIGGEGFKSVRKIYSLKYNSNGKHTLTETDYDTLVEDVIFTDLEDSAGEQIFNITPNNYFSDLKLFQDKYIITTDGVSGLIYCINVERLKSGGYGVVTQDAFNLLKAQPLVPIKAEYIDNPNKKSNLLKGKLFQFRQQNGFEDYMKSSWGTISNRPVPSLELTDSIGDNPSRLNAIKLVVDIGDELVTNINLAFRAELYDWYIFKRVKRSYILALENTEIDVEQEIYEAYNPTTNKYTLLFYNDGAQEAVSALDTDELYDNIPQNVGALEIVNGDIIAVADLTEGYDRPSGLGVNFSVAGYKAQLDVSLSNPRNFTKSGTDFTISDTHRRFVTIELDGVPKEGDVLTIQLGALKSYVPTNFITYTANSDDDENLTSFINNLYNRLPDTKKSGSRIFHKSKTMDNPTHGRVSFVTASYEELKGTTLNLDQTGDLEGRALNILKSNTSYQLALFHFDRFGRAFPIVTGDDYVVNTTSFAATEGLSSEIGWSLNSTPPIGAVSYQWGLSENTKYLKNLWVTGIYDEEESKNDYIIINLASLDRYVKDLESNIIAYDFAEGDRVTFQYTFSGSNTPVKWFNNPPLDFAISGFEIKVDTDVTPNITSYLLKIKKSAILPIIDIIDKEVLLEIYTPKKNNKSIDTEVFYEIGEQFDILNGEYTVKSGSIRKGDAYIRPRKFLSNVDNSNSVFILPIEDFNFSDDYNSNFWSAGRGRAYNDEVGKVRRKASFRYSDTFAIDSLNNNINRFYANRIYGNEPAQTTSIYGAIVKMVMRDNYLISIQELKVGHIPVNSTILEDQAEQQNVAISNKLFNNVRYLPSNIGAGLAKKAIAVSDRGVVYFVDPNNGYPCRDGYDGLSIINVKMSKYFIEKLKTADPNKILSYFDDFNQEWNITFSNSAGDIEVISFSESEWEYRDNYELTVDDVTVIQPDNGTLTTTIDGNLLYTPDSGYVGQDTAGIVFIVNSQVINKNACITIIGGTDDIQDFSFIDLFNQELSTNLPSNYNFATGITIAVPISIVGGEYSINDGAWTALDGTISLDDEFRVRVMSSASYETTTSTTLTIADKSATFNVTTKPEVTTYYSVEKSGIAFKSDCESGQAGTSVTYVVPERRYTSIISQEDADEQAQEDVDTNKQANADDFGTCIVGTLYRSISKSGTATKNNCTLPAIGSAVTYVVPAERYSSYISQIDADNKAQLDVDANKQSNANALGTCTVPETVGNDLKTQTFQKNNCTLPQVGTNVTYTVPANRYYSSNKANANNLALAEIASNGQSNANSLGTCIAPSYFTFQVVIYDNFRNVRYNPLDSRLKSFEFTNGSGYSNVFATKLVSTAITRNAVVHTFSIAYSGTTISINAVRCYMTTSDVTVSGFYTSRLFHNGSNIGNFNESPISGISASTEYTILVPTAITTTLSSSSVLRLEHGSAVIPPFYSVSKSGTATKNNCLSGQVGSTVTLTVPERTFTSTISQEDADAQAQAYVDANKQNNANTFGTCTSTTTFYNTIKSAPATKNNCTLPAVGSTVTYVVPADRYSSTISQIDADNQAQLDVDANKQSNANALGTCTVPSIFYNTPKSGTATKNNCGVGETPSTVTYTVPADRYSSTISQVDADNQAQADVELNKQNNANTFGTCTVPTPYSSISKSGIATKNNCGTGSTGSTVTYTVPANRYSSYVSQADADAQAQADVDANKQNNANTFGTCTINFKWIVDDSASFCEGATIFYTATRSATFTRNDCAEGYIGASYLFTKTYTSSISQEDADNQASTDPNFNTDGQLFANDPTVPNSCVYPE